MECQRGHEPSPCPRKTAMKPSKEIIDFVNLTITDELILHEDLSDKWLEFKNVNFQEFVDFSGLRARGVGFYQCSFLKGIDLSGVTLANDLIAYKTTFNAGPTLENAPPALRLDGARIAGEIDILFCTIQGGIFAENLRVAGDADFRGTWVHRNLGTPLTPSDLEPLADADDVGQVLLGMNMYNVTYAFKLTGSRIEGNLRLGALYDEPV